MKKINKKEVDKFVADSTLLLGNEDRPGIILTSNDRIGKFFYKRKFISTSTFIPQAVRFLKNSKALVEANVRGPQVDDIVFCPDIPAHIVFYDRIKGTDLRELCAREGADILRLLPSYLSHLHNTGIYFRAIHLGNVIRCEDFSLALVDISDLYVRRFPLSISRRVRNLVHLIDTSEDIGFFEGYGLEKFIDEYNSCSALSLQDQEKLKKKFFARSNFKSRIK